MIAQPRNLEDKAKAALSAENLQKIVLLERRKSMRVVLTWKGSGKGKSQIRLLI